MTPADPRIAFADQLLRPHDPVWSVRADALQDAGDPRGELIAVEARALRTDSPALWTEAHRMRATHEARVDDVLGALAPSPWLCVAVDQWRYGYVTSLVLEQPFRVKGRSGEVSLSECEELRYLSSLQIEVHALLLERVLAMLERERPVLRRLSLHTSERDQRLSFDAEQCQRLCLALPHLRELELRGVRMYSLDHPVLEVAKLYGVGTRLGREGGLPRLHTLAIAEVPRASRAVPIVFANARVPSLTHLDLDPRFASSLLGYGVDGVEVAAFIESFLDVPALDVDTLQRLTVPWLWTLDAPQRSALLPRLRDVPELVSTQPVEEIWADRGVDWQANLDACVAALPNLELRPPPAHVGPRGHEVLYLSWAKCRAGEPGKVISKRTVSRVVPRSWSRFSPAQREAITSLFLAWSKLERGSSTLTLETVRLHELLVALVGPARDRPRNAEGGPLEIVAKALESHLDCCPQTTLQLR